MKWGLYKGAKVLREKVSWWLRDEVARSGDFGGLGEMENLSGEMGVLGALSSFRHFCSRLESAVL